MEEIPLAGAHNKANVAAAVAAVFYAAPSSFVPAKIAEAIRNFQTLPHRLEVVAVKDGLTFVNDSQSTIPDATIAALASFPAPVTLLVGGRAKIGAQSYRALMQKVAETQNKIIFFGESATMLEQIALSCDVEKLHIARENTLAEALQTAVTRAVPGETIVLSPACASFDQFQSYEARGQTFRALVEAM